MYQIVEHEPLDTSNKAGSLQFLLTALALHNAPVLIAMKSALKNMTLIKTQLFYLLGQHSNFYSERPPYISVTHLLKTMQTTSIKKEAITQLLLQ